MKLLYVHAVLGMTAAPAGALAESMLAAEASCALPSEPEGIPGALDAAITGAAALDKGIEQEEVAKKVIGSTEFQNKAREGRNQYRRVLGIEYVRELILP